MENYLTNENQNIPYSVKLSKRARHIRISVACDSSVVLTVPRGVDLGFAKRFINSKVSWIINSLERLKPFRPRPIVRRSKKEYIELKQQALALAKVKVEQWNAVYNFSYKRVSVKNQKTRWGSCSKNGNLNFNYKIAKLPEVLVDYLVVHELCHLKEFNHSRNFWALVAQTHPDYKKLRAELKSYHT